MQAVTYSSFGPADQVLEYGEIETASPGPGEVVVELAYSGVNPSDVKARAGARPGVTKPAFPRICPHSDGAGVITKTGAGVDRSRIGQRVWVWNGQWQRAFGTAASHIALPAEQAVPLPKGVSFETGASLGIPGLTAAHTVFGGGDIAGKTVLIHGGAGSVGYLAVQLAVWAGAKVITTASPSDFDYCKSAGAQKVLDYHAANLAQHVMDATQGEFCDRIIDVEFGKNIATNAEVITLNGTIAVYGSAKDMTPTLSFGPLLFKAAKIDIALIYVLPPNERAAAISNLHNALSEKALSCPVSKVFALEHTALAHQAVERGGRKGAILVAPGQ